VLCVQLVLDLSNLAPVSSYYVAVATADSYCFWWFACVLVTTFLVAVV